MCVFVSNTQLLWINHILTYRLALVRLHVLECLLFRVDLLKMIKFRHLHMDFHNPSHYVSNKQLISQLEMMKLNGQPWPREATEANYDVT